MINSVPSCLFFAEGGWHTSLTLPPNEGQESLVNLKVLAEHLRASSLNQRQDDTIQKGHRDK